MKKWISIFFLLATTYLFGQSVQTILKSQGVLTAEFLRDFKEKFDLRSFIETGIYIGDTLAVAADVFPEVYSIDVSEPHYRAAEKRFATYNNVHLYLGDTTFLLKQMIADSPDGKRLYWLDAHCSGGGTGGIPGYSPIPYELNQIFSYGDFDSVILIDDLRGFYHGDDRTNLPLREIQQIVKAANPYLQFYSIGDIGLIFNEKSHPLISVSPLVKAASFSRFFDPHCEDEGILEQLIEAEKFIGSYEGGAPERENFHKLVRFCNPQEGMGGEAFYLFWNSLYELEKGDVQTAISSLQILTKSFLSHWRMDAYLVKALVLNGRIEEAHSLFQKQLNSIHQKYPKLLKKILGNTYLSVATPLSIQKVVIWGHKLHSHTHSYIHERFFRAFQYLGYPTHWFDEKDDVTDFDFAHSLFITEGQVDGNIPLRLDCQYILHNCTAEKYRPLFDASRCITMQIYTDAILSIPDLIQVEPFIYYNIPGKCVYFPWASDYLPDEIDALKKQLVDCEIEKDRCVYWIGTIGSSASVFGNSAQLAEFQRACSENQIAFKHYDPWSKGLDRTECADLHKKGYFIPAIVGTWQEQNGYIPCRIFLSIGAGQMGVTNSYRTYELFNKKIVYNSDCYQLFYDAEERKKTWTLQDQFELMDFIKEKHTYLNRVHTLLDFMAVCRNKRLDPK